jgi:hypothetical protein
VSSRFSFAAAGFEERAAFLEFCCCLERHKAEAEAARDIYDALITGPFPGGDLLSELVGANHRQHHPEFAEVLGLLGLTACRAPLWGGGRIVDQGLGMYRPAELEEIGAEPAIIVPAITNLGIEDLVANGLRSRRTLTRHGLAAVVGAIEIDKAREHDQPLLVFNDPLAWLRGDTHGIVVIDWKTIGAELDGVRALICSPTIAPRLHQATRCCWPRPVVATPPRKDLQHAA